MKKTFNDFVEESREQLEIINSDKLNNMINEKEDIVIIDVNDKEDVEKRGMIDGAVNISLGTLFYKADENVPEDFKDQRIQNRNQKVVVTCSLGLCAAIGGKLLKDMGFEDVALLEGGVSKWEEDGYTLKK
ncbi:MAG: sulfurtransferase [Candidatus Marinimicrobia bacterium]|nr:sulfurtransferase [Candidatus Neomarinimicrobiota bacterium]|tara:strand:- start:94 stop:486 length:393 start_codon:yes stop_codon:yes gene_type:complete